MNYDKMSRVSHRIVRTISISLTKMAFSHAVSRLNLGLLSRGSRVRVTPRLPESLVKPHPESGRKAGLPCPEPLFSYFSFHSNSTFERRPL
jgi:hypothetical protein